MFTTDLKRIVRSGFLNFWRSGVVSLASILIMTITLFVIGSLIFMNAVLDFSLEKIQQRVDVNIYFYPGATEDNIFRLQEVLTQLPEVDTVNYVSREDALAQFTKRHENDALTLQALEELDENPLGASLNIRAKETSQYESISNFLESDTPLVAEINPDIEKINYFENKVIIDRLSNIIQASRKLGLLVTIVFVVISVIITFNTIRLAIYVSRDEISVMRLVGAENTYIRGPFMIEGIIYGVVSAIVMTALFYPITLWLSKHTTTFFGGMDLFHYYINNFPQVFLIILLAGVLLGAFSSFLAIQRYLKK